MDLKEAFEKGETDAQRQMEENELVRQKSEIASDEKDVMLKQAELIARRIVDSNSANIIVGFTHLASKLTLNPADSEKIEIRLHDCDNIEDCECPKYNLDFEDGSNKKNWYIFIETIYENIGKIIEAEFEKMGFDRFKFSACASSEKNVLTIKGEVNAN